MKSRILMTTQLSAVVLMSLASFGTFDQKPAQAFDLRFAGESSGQWTLPLNADDTTRVVDGAGGTASNLEWGRTDCVGCTVTNSIQYTGAPFIAEVGSLFRVGDLSYRNGSVLGGFNGDFALNVSLLFMKPVQQLQTFSFLFNVLNTDNVTGDPVLDGDRLRFSTGGVSGQDFSYNGTDYTLELVGFSSDGGNTILQELNSPEDSTTNASLFGKITAKPAVCH